MFSLSGSEELEGDDFAWAATPMSRASLKGVGGSVGAGIDVGVEIGVGVATSDSGEGEIDISVDAD